MVKCDLKETGFPLPDQIEDKLSGNDKEEIFHPYSIPSLKEEKRIYKSITSFTIKSSMTSLSFIIFQAI